MKIAIYYFSGTGNTELVCKKWAEEAKKHHVECDLFKVEDVKEEKVDVSNYDKVGIAYPIHAFNAPKVLWKFTTRIAKLSAKKPAFIIMVSGEYMTLNHSSDYKVARILKRRNLVIESEYHYLMPYNMIFRHTEKRAYEMYKTMLALSELDVKEYLSENKPHKLKKHLSVHFIIWLIRIEQLYAPLYGKMLRIKKKKCIKCMKCVNSCPLNNIKYADGKFKFGWHCTLCARCSFNCPTNAFSCGFLQLWKVNGRYKFKEPEIEEIDKHKRYCKKSYLRYYKEASERLNQIEK